MSKFSVLMTIYKSENPLFLDRAFKSIWSDQILKPNQIVIVKDGPLTLDLNRIIKKWIDIIESNLQVYSLEKNFGLGYALNHGLQFCKNEYIARMDTDDISMPSRFFDQVNFLDNNESIDMVGSQVIEFLDTEENHRGMRKVPTEHEKIIKFSKYRNPFNHPSVMYKKSKVLEAGGPLNFTDFDDYFLWIRMIKNNTKFANLNYPLVYMRANIDQAKRRGGMTYLKNEVKFINFMLKCKHINLFQYLLHILIRLPVRIFPNSLRHQFYKYLRAR